MPSPRPTPAARTLACAFATTCFALGTAPGQSFDLEQRRGEHWAWQPLADVTAPTEGHPIDALLLPPLRELGLAPSPPAPPYVQLRRLWLDLVGLPPPVEATERFLADPSDSAWAREVDALLQSPHFGERWGRHWLDLVRYAESLGHEFDYPIANAWRYRDYVIRAFNADVPYDQFLREHIAGDLLAEPRRSISGDNESVQATAAWWFVEQTHSPVDARQHRADRIDNQIDVLGKAMLGMTVACARCHDHKFDAISQADYYALFGFVKSSRYVQAPIRPVDTAGDAWAAALTAQRDLARAWAEAAAPADGRWQPLTSSSPPRWAASAGTGPLRDGDRVIASTDDPAGWLHTNDGFGERPWRGPWCPDPASATPELRLLPGAYWHSGIAGNRREGVLQTATFTIDERWLHVRAAGRNSRIVVIVDGFHVVRNPIYGGLHRTVNKPQAHWLTYDLGQWPGHDAFVQCIDQTAHDLGDPTHSGGRFWPDDGWLAVQAVIASQHREAPPADHGTALPHRPWSDLPAAVSVALAQLTTAQAALPVSATLPGLSDGTGTDAALYLRGDHRTPGAVQPRRFLTALVGDEAMPIPLGSGRLQLAASILAADNPLPSRTLCNRLWHHLFGRGLSRSVDNLGVLGEPPSNPRLLDWLARDFVDHGWSIKHSLRRIVTSHAYRQSSRDGSAGRERDPGNRTVHRQNVRRLEAEAVRDSLLAIGGRLDRTLYGESIPIPHDGFPHARGKPPKSGPLDGHGRRSIYLAIRRNFLPPMLLSYDLPTPFATVGRRNVSNVPAQALTLLNDPLVHAMSKLWAERLLAAHGSDPDGRLAAAYLDAFARAPTAQEAAQCREFVRAAAAEHGTDLDDPRPWTELLHCLVNTKEFTFRR